jgi:PTS system mannose-specific IIC component/fructoselysine and glucoselysine-specific PTS system IIC component
MITQAILVGLVGAIGQLDAKLFGEARISQPIVMGFLVGLVLGDVKTGLILGAEFQLVWMGIVGVGATPSMDVATGSTLGTAFMILTGSSLGVALALALPVALLMQYCNVLVRATITPSLMHIGDRYAREGNTKMIARLQAAGIFAFTFLLGFLPAFLAILLGSSAVEGLVGAIPGSVMNGLNAISKLFPAIGFGMLLHVTMEKNLAGFFIIGFVLAAYLQLNVLAVALIGTAAALIMYHLKSQEINKSHAEEEVL